MTRPGQVAIIGSGFAGTVLARILHRRDVPVVLLERHRHPRFAIGESSTPLAAICLERLARRYELPDLADLATYGRWLEQLPELRRGLKRGFSFYRHWPDTEFVNGVDNEHRLLVAASPDDAVSDCHWLREDVDAFLVGRAVAEGVDYREETEVEGCESDGAGGWRLHARSGGERFEVPASVIIDGSGEGGLLARSLPLDAALDRVALDTALVFGHFEGVGDFVKGARAGGARLDEGPYPDERAAVHHLLEEGWMYVLPFDHGVVSAGLVLRREAFEQLGGGERSDAEGIWRQVLGRYPTLARQFADAKPTRPVAIAARLQRRLAQAAGANWALLPHTFAFFDPMFSTGIAWSLLAVERLALLLESAAGPTGLAGTETTLGLERYGQQLESEADQMTRLLEGAFLAMSDFGLFCAQSFLYFAVVSHEEVDQRLRPEGRRGAPPAGRGFLGAGEPQLEALFSEATARLRKITHDGDARASRSDRRDFYDWVRAAIADRNIVGLADPSRRNLYPVDLDLLVERAELLGMSRHELRSQLHLLRGRGP